MPTVHCKYTILLVVDCCLIRDNVNLILSLELLLKNLQRAVRPSPQLLHTDSLESFGIVEALTGYWTSTSFVD